MAYIKPIIGRARLPDGREGVIVSYWTTTGDDGFPEVRVVVRVEEYEYDPKSRRLQEWADVEIRANECDVWDLSLNESLNGPG